LETAAWVEYRLNLTDRFFSDGNVRVANLLSDFVLHRYGFHNYIKKKLVLFDLKKDEATTGVEVKGGCLQLFKENIPWEVREDDDEKHDVQFQTWLRFFVDVLLEYKRPQFTDPKAWEIRNYHGKEILETFIHPQYIENSKYVRDLSSVMGMPIRKLINFRPVRFALHEVITQLICSIQLENEEQFKNLVGILTERVLLRLDEALLDDGTLKNKRSDFFDRTKLVIETRCSFDDEVRDLMLAGHKMILEGRKRLDDESNKRFKFTDLHNLLVKFVVDNLMRNYVSKRMTWLVSNELDKLSKEFCISPLRYYDNYERASWIILGGPASGKSSLVAVVHEQIGNDLWRNTCKVNPDDYKPLLLTDEFKKFSVTMHAAIVHMESSIISKRILSRLQEMVIKEGKGPHLMFDAVKPSVEKYDLSHYAGATTTYFVASCPIPEAIYRAFHRGKSRGRYVPTPIIISGHRELSARMPDAVSGDHKVFLRIFNTDVSRYVASRNIALIDDCSSELVIRDIRGMLTFVEKAGAILEADSKDQLYPPENENYSTKVKLLMQYVEKGLILKLQTQNSTKKTYAVISKRSGLVITHLQRFFAGVGGRELGACLIDAFMKYQSPKREYISVVIHRGLGQSKIFVATNGVIRFWAKSFQFQELSSRIPFVGFNKSGFFQNKSVERQRTQSSDSKILILCEQFLEKCPDHVDTLQSYGLALLKVGRHKKALLNLQLAAVQLPGNIGLQNNIGVVLFKLEQYSEALSIYENIIGKIKGEILHNMLI